MIEPKSCVQELISMKCIDRSVLILYPYGLSNEPILKDNIPKMTKDAKKEIEEDFNESIQQQFDDSDNITDKGIADYAEKLAEVKKLAKYKVQDVKEEDGVYTVSVQVEPSNVFQTLQQSSTEVSNEKIKQGLDGNDPEVFAAVLTESVQKSLEKNSYGKTVTVKVSVEKDNSGKYGLSDTEMSKLETAMFPTE